MGTQQDLTPLSTEVSPVETEVDLQTSARFDIVSRDGKSIEGSGEGDTPMPHRLDGTDQPKDAAGDDRLAIGQRLSGRYRIERELGEGGMGVVYLATDEQVAGETFAIKVLKESLRPEALELLREEVRKTRKLSHPNIVDVHSVNVGGRCRSVAQEAVSATPASHTAPPARWAFLAATPRSRAMQPSMPRGAGLKPGWSVAPSAAAPAGGTGRRAIRIRHPGSGGVTERPALHSAGCDESTATGVSRGAAVR